ncbi:MAG: right-handed parallel beta-helix repeat-containing protein [Thermoplasmata archaeon]
MLSVGGYIVLINGHPVQEELMMSREKNLFQATVYVPDDYPTIGSAVENVSSGDTVIVRDNTYYEKNIVINKTLNLKSEFGYQNCIIDVDSYVANGMSGFIIEADWVNVTGFTIQKPGEYSTDAGIKIKGVNNVNASQNYLRWSRSNGILVEDTKDTIITNNTFDELRRGIRIVADQEDNQRTVVSNNTVKNCKTGLYLRENDPKRVCYSLFKNNHFYECGAGGSDTIHDDSKWNHNNEFVNNVINNSYNGIKIESASSSNLVSNNTIYDIDVYSIRLNSGLYNQGPGPLVQYNHIRNAARGIQVSSYNYDSQIYNNKIEGCGDYGVYLGKNDNKIENNTISNCYNGIQLGRGESHVIKNNTISGSTQYGIFENDVGPGECQNFLIKDNYITASQLYGIYLGDTDIGGHKIYHNNFINNVYGAYDIGFNIWNASYPTGGNYWSDYEGYDIYSGPDQDQPGSDGIGDNNYSIDGSSDVDEYPLMEPISKSIYSLDLYAFPDSDGWNFVSFNLAPTETSLTSILINIDGTYDRVMYYDASVDEWLTYVPGRPEHFNDLREWNHTIGVWIRMIGNDTLTLVGDPPSSTNITLYPEWNMVGLPSKTAGNHGLPGEMTKVGYFDASAEYNLAYDYDPANFTFEPGQGYWVYNGANESVVWTVEY